jgi:hypothetical protein
MPTPAKNQPAPPPPADPAAEVAPTGLEDLSRRVAALERQVGGMLTGQVAEISQEERDRQTLSRRPNSYPEAVEYEAAQRRQEERDRKAAKSGKGDGSDEADASEKG